MKMGKHQANHKSNVTTGREAGGNDVEQSHVKFHEPPTSSSQHGACVSVSRYSSGSTITPNDSFDEQQQTFPGVI